MDGLIISNFYFGKEIFAVKANIRGLSLKLNITLFFSSDGSILHQFRHCRCKIAVKGITRARQKYVVKRKTASVLRKFLRGHLYKITKEAIDPKHCVVDCWAENDRCQSLNYFPNWDIYVN